MLMIDIPASFLSKMESKVNNDVHLGQSINPLTLLNFRKLITLMICKIFLQRSITLKSYGSMEQRILT